MKKRKIKKYKTRKVRGYFELFDWYIDQIYRIKIEIEVLTKNKAEIREIKEKKFWLEYFTNKAFYLGKELFGITKREEIFEI